MPPSVWAGGLGHLLTALSWCGPSDELEAVAKRLRQRVIPEYHAFYHCYAHYNLGDVLASRGQYQQAATHWRRYLQLDPRSPWADDVRTRLAELDE